MRHSLACKLDTAVKYHSNLVGLLRVVDPMARDVPHLTAVEMDFFDGHSLSVATLDDFRPRKKGSPFGDGCRVEACFFSLLVC